MNSLSRTPLSLLVLFVLAACGGSGDGGGGGSSNTAPVSNAGSDQTVDEQVNVTLDGSASSDPDTGTTLTYSWTQFSGSPVTISSANAAQANFDAPDVAMGSSIDLEFDLRVSDGSLSNTDRVRITVGGTSNTNPTANAGGDQTIAEGVTVTLNGSGSGPDVGDTLTFSWAQTAGPVVTITNPDQAVASFTAPQVDSGGDTLTFELTVSDGMASATDDVIIDITDGPASVTISGQVQYKFVPPRANCRDLVFLNEETRPVRGATIELIEVASGNPVATDTLDNFGSYTFPGMMPNRDYHIRVKAELKDAGALPNWDVDVRDNTDAGAGALQNRALYVLDGQNFNSGSSPTMMRPNLVAETGWNTGAGSYTGDRNAAPFAILDAAYSAIQLVLSADATADFPALDMFWSVNNRGVGSIDYDIGELTTAHYTTNPDGGAINPSLFLRGDWTTNQDEFDDHVTVHEWGHYFEDTFSRSNSPGGGHALGEVIDARLAWGEGWAHALAGIALDEPNFCDTAHPGANNGFGFNVESQSFGTPGWHNEISVGAFVYDLWDTVNDGVDTGSIGWGPIYDTMVGGQRSSGSFTTVFSFAGALMNEIQPGDVALVNTMLAGLNVDTAGLDDWASAETAANNTQLPVGTETNTADIFPLYEPLTPDGTAETHCTNSDYDDPAPGNDGNKLGSFQYFRFNIAQARTYRISVTTTGTGGTAPNPGTDPPAQPGPGFNCDAAFQADPDDPEVHTYSDPDWLLYQGPLLRGVGFSCTPNSEVQLVALQAGEHAMDLRDYRHADEDTIAGYPGRVCYEISVTPQ